SVLDAVVTQITALFKAGQVWVPICGSPNSVPLPCRSLNLVNPLMSFSSNRLITSSERAWLNMIMIAFMAFFAFLSEKKEGIRNRPARLNHQPSNKLIFFTFFLWKMAYTTG